MSIKLVIVEGLPGSGKSVTARMVYETLVKKCINAEIYLEGNYKNPADYEGTAYFSYDELSALEQKYLDRVEILDKMKEKHSEGYLIRFRKAIDEQLLSYEDELFHDIARNDIYELPIGIHKRMILDKWSNFTEKHIKEDMVIVLECCLIQNPITVSMIKHNDSREVTMKYIKNIEKIVRPLDPLIIYVEQNDIRKSFTKAISERPKKWFEEFEDYYINQGYGLHNHLKGQEGIIQILEERSALENAVFASLELKKRRINNTEFDCDLLKEKITDIIEDSDF